MPTRADVLQAFLRTRRSVRRFKSNPVPAPVIERILTTATHAPSAHNLQPWRFCVVTTSVIRTHLANALTSAMRADMTTEGASKAEIEARATRSIRRINGAPVIILLCRDVNAVRADTPEEKIMSIQSVASAATYLLLAAHAEELGGNWICWPLYAQAETCEVLGLPETWEPQAIIFIGRAHEEPKKKVLKPLSEVIQYP